jgi:hypothetical protein
METKNKFPTAPYQKGGQCKILWGALKAKAKADGVIMGIQVTAYDDVKKHYKTTLEFFETACDAWNGEMKKPVLVLLWLVKGSSKRGKDGVIKVKGRKVFQFFRTFTDIGLSSFDR